MKVQLTLLSLAMVLLYQCVKEDTATAGTTATVACSTISRTSGTGTVSTSPVTNNDMTQAELTDMLKQINAVRVAGNCTCPASGDTAESSHLATTALTWSALLETSAAGHSKDMVDNNFFSHTGSSGSSLSSRVSATGYSWTYVAENIAAGQASVTAVMQGWMESGGHCRNIMSTKPTEIGVSLRNNTGTASFSKYWTQNFGKQ